MLGRDLGLFVDVARRQRRVFAGNARCAVAVNADGTAVHELLHPRRLRRFEQVPGSVQVNRFEEGVLLSALSHGDGEVKDVGHAAHGLATELRIGDASGQNRGTHAGEELRVGPLFRAIG